MIVVLSTERSPECMAPEASNPVVGFDARPEKQEPNTISCVSDRPEPQPAVNFVRYPNDPRLKARNLRMRESHTQRTRPITVKAPAHREQTRYSKGSGGLCVNGLARGLCFN